MELSVFRVPALFEQVFGGLMVDPHLNQLLAVGFVFAEVSTESALTVVDLKHVDLLKVFLFNVGIIAARL